MSRLWAVVLPVLVVSSTALQAQWGIHASPLNFESLSPRGNWNMILGLDHDLTDRSGFAIDINYGVDLFGSGEMDGESVYNGTNVYYNLERKAFGFTYRSMYFFGDNENGTVFYMGPMLGLRRMTYVAIPSVYSSYDPDPAWVRKTTTSATLFPIALRMGVRSPLDGFFGEFYGAIGTLVGSTKDLDLVYLAPRDQMNKLFWTLGYSIGIGWY